MALPGNVKTVTVTGTYVDTVDGTPISGTVTFSPNVEMLADEDAKVLLARGSTTVTLDDDGKFSTTLIDTGEVDLSPTGWCYSVSESLSGGRRRSWLLVIPDGVTEVDIAEVQPAGSAPEIIYYVTRSAFDAHADASTSVHGIADTAALETLAGATSKVSSHSGLTSGVHGLPDTSTIVVTSDSRLSDARTPTVHAASHAAGQSDAVSPSSIGAAPSTRTLTAGSGLTGGGDLSADRSFSVSDLTSSNFASGSIDGTAGTASLRTLGTGATQAAAGNHGHSAADVGAQPADDDLTAIAGLSTTGLISRTGPGTAATVAIGTGASDVAAGDDARIVGAAQKNSNLSDLTDAATARANLGIGYVVNSPLIPRATTVVIGCYPEPITSGVAWGTNISHPTRHFINKEQISRVRQNGVATHVKMYILSLTNHTALYVHIWRKNEAGTYDRVYQEDVLTKLVAGQVNTVALATPALVEEGDYVGYGIDTSGAPGTTWQALSTGTSVASRYQYTAPAATGVDWDAQISGTTYYLPVQLLGPAPMMASIGDSLTSGHPGSRSLIHTGGTFVKESCYQYWMREHVKWAYQNMGIGGQTSAQIAARFAADVVALSPRVCVILCGVNDLAAGTVSQAQFIANMTTMLDAAVAADIKPVVVKILPWTAGTTGKMQARDLWNTALAVLANTYPGAVVVDASAALGIFRAGGDPGNLWDIDPQYDCGDGVHLNSAGYARLAWAVIDGVGA